MTVFQAIIIAVFGVLFLFIYSIWNSRKRKEYRLRFISQKETDQEFLKALCGKLTPLETQIALSLRSSIAEAGDIPEESIRSEDYFYRDLPKDRDNPARNALH